MKQLYQDLRDKLLDPKNTTWDLKAISNKFLDEKVQETTFPLTLNISERTDENYEYISRILSIFTILKSSLKSFNWTTSNPGTFFTKVILSETSFGLPGFHDFYTIDGDNVSLPEISHMFSAMHFKALPYEHNQMYTPAIYKEAEPCDYMDLFCTPKEAERMSAFAECFVEISKMEKVEEIYAFDGESLYNDDNFELALVCSNLESYPSCKTYCQWHEHFLKRYNKEHFMTLMKYALPQRKMIAPTSTLEKELASEYEG